MWQNPNNTPVLNESTASSRHLTGGVPLCCSMALLTWLPQAPFADWKFPLISCLYIHLSPQLLLSLFYWLSPLPIPIPSFPWSHVLAPFLFLNKPIQILGLNLHSHLMVPKLHLQPWHFFLEFQGSNSAQPKPVTKFLSNPCHLPQINGAAMVEAQSRLLPLSTPRLLSCTSHSGSLSRRLSPFTSLSPLFFSVHPTHNAKSYLLALFQVKSQVLTLMFETQLSLD